jgi:hypothetical protein
MTDMASSNPLSPLCGRGKRGLAPSMKAPCDGVSTAAKKRGGGGVRGGKKRVPKEVSSGSARLRHGHNGLSRGKRCGTRDDSVTHARSGFQTDAINKREGNSSGIREQLVHTYLHTNTWPSMQEDRALAASGRRKRRASTCNALAPKSSAATRSKTSACSVG